MPPHFHRGDGVESEFAVGTGHTARIVSAGSMRLPLVEHRWDSIASDADAEALYRVFAVGHVNARDTVGIQQRCDLLCGKLSAGDP